MIDVINVVQLARLYPKPLILVIILTQGENQPIRVYNSLADAAAAASVTNKVGSKLAMVADVVVAAVKEDRNTAAALAAVVDDVLGQSLDQVAGDTAGALEEEANAAAGRVPLAGNVLAILVGAARINVAVDGTDNILQVKGWVVAKVVTLAVNSSGLDGDGGGKGKEQGSELHSKKRKNKC